MSTISKETERHPFASNYQDLDSFLLLVLGSLCSILLWVGGYTYSGRGVLSFWDLALCNRLGGGFDPFLPGTFEDRTNGNIKYKKKIVTFA